MAIPISCPTPIHKRNSSIDPENFDLKPTDNYDKMSSNKTDSRPALIHAALHDIPQTIRFSMSGILNTVLFLVFYSTALAVFKNQPAAKIYTIVNMIMLPVGHANSSLIVFGWPKHYLPNLLMNAPIGLSATFIGTVCTGMLNNMNFDAMVKGLLKGIFMSESNESDSDGDGQFFTSILVMIITGIWSFILSTIVNSPKKEKKGDKDKEL